MFSIVIPVFNEAHNLIRLVNEISSVLKPFKTYEVILVNDASNDSTLEVIKNISIIQNIKILSNKINKGQSYSIYKGVKEAKYDTIITLDGDGQNNPKDIPLLYDYYTSNKDIFLVGGIRKKRRDSFIKIISSRIATKIRSKILKDDCVDTGCSLKVFSRKVFLSFPYFNGMHRFLPALFKGYDYKCFYLFVDHRIREKGFSNYGTFDRLYRGIIDIIKVRKIIKEKRRKT